MSKTRGTLHRSLTMIALLAVAAVLIGIGIGGYWYLGPYSNFTDQVFVDVEHGMSSRAIAQKLADEGVVRSKWSFLLVRALHPLSRLQAGEYRFAGDESAWRIFNKIKRGEIFYEEFTVPEGDNIFDIAALLRQSDTVTAEAFLKAAADPTMIQDLDPHAPSLEGYLFPSTYRATRKTTANQLCHLMTGEFRKQWKTLEGSSRVQDIHQAITLASIVEKESALPSERPLVASVYLNRLRLEIPLQCDPTTIYAAMVEKKYTGVIHRSDLDSTNPYNTYTHLGLPPGPIANPGRASLTAVLHPANSEYLYFVANPGLAGSHHFSNTLAEHNKAVAEYRAQAKTH